MLVRWGGRVSGITVNSSFECYALRDFFPGLEIEICNSGRDTHHAHMFALRDCWDRHDFVAVDRSLLKLCRSYVCHRGCANWMLTSAICCLGKYSAEYG